jgi:BioD-like phosphotransacetylase family protein
MEALKEILQWLTLHIKELSLTIFGTTIGGISIWKLLSMCVALIKKSTKKKYLKEIERRENELNKRFDLLEEKLTGVIVEQVDKCAITFENSFNSLEKQKLAEKQKIYNKHFHKNMEVKEIVPEEEKEAEIDIIEPVEEKVEEIIEPVQEIEQEPQKKVDLL